MSKDTKAAPEQITYANMLFYGCWGSLALMVLTYCLYGLGVMAPHVPLEKTIELWSQPVGVYLQQGEIPTGWGWASMLNKGDFLNFLGIALLAGMTILCYIPLIGAYLKKNDKLYAALAIAEVLVLCVAASGVVGSGGH